MRGRIICAGVGPGDPELMTLKACRLCREADVIAVPGKEPKESVAYRTARSVVPEIEEKEIVGIYMPMIKDREAISEEHREGAGILAGLSDAGKTVLYLTLGDPTIYCTFSYLQHILEAEGYEIELVSGISSVTAAAASLSLPLCEWDEPLHIVPAVHRTKDRLSLSGNYVLMKSASSMAEVKELIRESGRKAQAVENCGMESERIFRSVEEIPDDSGYFSLIVVK